MLCNSDYRTKNSSCREKRKRNKQNCYSLFIFAGLIRVARVLCGLWLLDGGRTADDLGYLLRDRRLTCFVIDRLQFFNQVACIICSGFHRDHAR